MSASTAHGSPELRQAGGLEAAPLLAAWFMALAIMAAAFVPMAIFVVRDGTLFDNDDAMRLVQLREWMDGKSWFDLNERRVDPPDGMISHWSRLIELPLAGGIAVLSPFVERDLAERIVVAVWPSILLAALVLGLLVLARRLFAPPTLIAAAAVIALNPLLQFQLAPGRIDHHGVQMLLVLLLAFATIRALVDGSARAAVVGGAIGAVILAIGLETLPLVALAAALFGLAWIVRGDAVRRQVAEFGLAFAFAEVVLYTATVAPSRWSMTACDALSPPWLWLAFAGGIALAGLAFIDAPARPVHRALWAAFAGGATVAIFVAYWPHCLLGPLGDTDALVRELWLSDVGEVTSTVLLAIRTPEQFLFFLVFPLIGWVGLAIAAYRERRSAPDFALLFAFGSAATLIALGAMRGVPFASIFALFGWLYLIDRALAPLLEARGTRSSLLPSGVALVLLIGALPYVWNAIGTAAGGETTASVERASCGVRSDLAELGAESPGLVLAPLRLGPRILVATHHDVVGVPYHRNNTGSRWTFETLLTDPDTAHQRIKERGIRYVALCLGDTDLPRLTAYRSGSLLANLADGTAPDWLTPITPKGPMRAWRVLN